MKRSGDIASLFQKYESKKARSQSPSVAAAVLEEQMEEQEHGQDQDRVIPSLLLMQTRYIDSLNFTLMSFQALTC
jgi:hypothetical protein